ncbi:MAG TPA: hypothetical protein VE262_23660 [Blastocatellia bacterium]|nr:hypothetical protein [Blastocatellia bacterium]
MVHQLKKRIVFFLLVSMVGLSPSAFAQADRFEGRPAFAEGTELGYYIWKDGDTWHVRWTTRGQMRQFAGSVSAEGGELKSLKRIDVESERRVLYPGRAPRVVYGPRGRAHVRRGRAPVVVDRKQDKIEKDGDRRIVFLARTDDDIDGFDFKVDEEVKLLHFVLEIDGRRSPQFIEVGRDNRKIQSLPLLVRLN